MDNDPAMEDLSSAAASEPYDGGEPAYEPAPPLLVPRGFGAGQLPDIIPLHIKAAIDTATRSITIAGAEMFLSDIDELEGIQIGDQFILKEDRENAQNVPEWAKHATQIEVVGFIEPNRIALQVDGKTFELYTLELAERDFDITQATSGIEVKRAAAS